MNEDLYPSGDITTSLIKYGTNKSAKIISNGQGILAGTDFVKHTFNLIDRKLIVSFKKMDQLLKRVKLYVLFKGRLKIYW